MLQIAIPEGELWDEKSEEFISVKECVLQLEHSLVSLSKWESKWCKPFMSKDSKTDEETLDYIKCMTLNRNIDPNVYYFITNQHRELVNDYIAAPMTATWFNKDQAGKPSSEQITNELIYFWMISLNIPFECQKWHLNRLLTLIKVCEKKNQPAKKMSNAEALKQQAALNAARRKKPKKRG